MSMYSRIEASEVEEEVEQEKEAPLLFIISNITIIK